ncbi:ankyrin repeat-containing domain, PGG domain protein [Artemisia annua]|uniref:Ankyrin repeat-containing domain, PGG domain protein n=1 Tax=Artemisia annua TaxID=35608 RepID=A0A2U1MQI2_ARTAN|nr:ankyrin repeat-containing domain, PGG domain protein [Artemisia annua]
MYQNHEVYKGCLRGIWHPETVRYMSEATPVDKITNNGNTALHVAVGSSKNHEFLEELLELTPAENTLLDVQNLDGSTPLHVAAIVGNTEAAKILLRRNRNLLFATDRAGHTPLAISLSNMHIETSMCLLEHIRKEENCKVFTGRSGEELLILAISSKNWNFASELLERYETIHSEAVLMAMSQNYPRRCNFRDGLKEYEGTELDKAWEEMFHSSAWSRHTCAAYLWKLSIFGFIMIRGVSLFLFLKAALSFMGKRYMNRADARSVTNPNTYHHYYNNTIFEATRQNASDVVQSVVSRFADAIWCTNEDGHNFIQYAVINRSENVYSLVYKMSEHRNIYKTIKDSFGNNLLHLAARLAPANRLNNISGAALQLQRDLQWFKEIEEFVCPLNRTQKNNADETPEMVFTREHKDLVSEGEKWMKTTAESYTITAALITTIVFAAAITPDSLSRPKS